METPIAAVQLKNAPAPMRAPVLIRRICVAAMALMALHLLLYGGRSIAAAPGTTADFEYFYKASASLLEHGSLDARYDQLDDGTLVHRGGIEWYLPFVPRLYTVLSWMPARAAGTLWLFFNITVFFATLRLLARHFTGLPPQDWAVTQLVPVLCLGLFWHWEFRLNQINNLTMLLLLASFVLWRQQRHSIAGFWLGLAVLLKLTPGLIVIWFALKRQYRVVLVAGLTAVCAGPLADVVVFGPHYALQSWQNWTRTAVVNGSHRGLILGQREMDWRNQGFGAVACRWLHATNYNTHFDNDPRIRYPDEPKFINVANLELTTIVWIVTGVAAVSLLGLLWLARRPARDCPLWTLRLEFVLFIMAMLWFMPVMRRYHLIWMLPALSVLAACVHWLTPRERWSKLTLAAVGVVFASQLSILTRTFWGTHIVEAGGAFLFALAVVSVPLILLLLRLGRDPAALPLAPTAPGTATDLERSLAAPDAGRSAAGAARPSHV